MVVFVIGRGFPTRESPTNGIFEYTQALALKEQGLQVYYLYVDTRSFRHKRKLGISHIYQNDLNIVGYSIYGGKMPMYFRVLLRRIGMRILFRYCKKKSIVPDIIHAHFLEVIYATVNIKSFFNKPIIGTEHFSLALEKGSLCEERIKEEAYRGVNKLIAVSPTLQQILRRNYLINSEYVPNLIDDELFYVGAETRIYDFLCVGDLNKNKNFKGVINAFIHAFPRETDVTLNIIGVGHLKKEFEDIIIENGREKQINLLGKCENKDVAELMRRTKILIMNSFKETFGVVCIEAMMCGEQIISTKCGGPECFINDLNGVLVDVNNEENLAREMIRLLKMDIGYEDRMLISENAKKCFSKSVVTNKLIKIYNSMMQ